MIILSKSFNKCIYTVLDTEKNEDFLMQSFESFSFAITSKETEKKFKFWSICSSVLLFKIGKV